MVGHTEVILHFPDCRNSIPTLKGLDSAPGSRPRSLRARGPRLRAETRRRNGKFAFEGTVESRFWLIANFACYLGNRLVRGAQHVRAQLQPPSCEIGHRRLAEVMTEAFSQNGTRNPN